MGTTSNTDDEKVMQTLSKIIKVIRKKKLNIPELLVLYGNLGYHLGASIAGFDEKGPNLEEIKQEYHQNPTVDTGLMLQGLLITDWEKDYIERPHLSRLAKKKEGEEK